MELLSRTRSTFHPAWKWLSILLLLMTSGCTIGLGSNRVTTIPLVMLDEVPIPDQAKAPAPNMHTAAKDSAINAWFIGSDAWQADAVAIALKSEQMKTEEKSYFEGRFERFMLHLILFNYESVTLKGKWVRMVPRDPPPSKSTDAKDGGLLDVSVETQP